MLALALSAAAFGDTAAKDAPTPADAGELIYLQGTGSAGRPVEARHPGGGWRLRGAVVACANCHGLQREGGREGAVPAPSLRWVDATPAMRTALRRALATGRGRDGHPLDATMPRFELEEPEFEALYTYLHRANAAGQPAAALPLYLSLLPVAERRLPVEQELLEGLQRCLGPMAGSAAPVLRWQVITHASHEQALAQWRSAMQDPTLAAVVAPSLRGWKLEWAAAARTARDAAHRWPLMLYPLVDDPVASGATAPVKWLFGGPGERRQVLRQVWQQRASAAQRASAEPAWLTSDTPDAVPPTADPALRWVAVPALTGAEAAGNAYRLGALWAEAACATIQAAQQRAEGAPGAVAREPAQRVRWALQRLGRLETEGGLMLEPDRPIAVNDWSVWEFAPPNPPRLIEPRARLERAASGR